MKMLASGQAYPDTSFVHLVSQCYQGEALDMSHLDLRDTPQCKFNSSAQEWLVGSLRFRGVEELGGAFDS